MTINRPESLRKQIIRHPQFEKLETRLKDVMDESQNAGVGKGIAILGPSGVGKSTLLKSFAAEVNAAAVGRFSKPAVIVDIPSAPTNKSVASAILASLGDPFAFAARHSAEEKQGRIASLFNELNTRILILDEGQHLSKRRRSVQYETADWIKGLLNASSVMVVFAGLPTLEQFIHSNEQLRRRFSASHRYEPFNLGDNMSMRNFMGVLHAFQSQLPVNSISLTSADVAQRFYFASGGLIDYLVKILERAVAIAVNDAVGEIHMGVFARAFLDEVWSSAGPTRNPFDKAFDMRPLTYGGEPFEGYNWSVVP